MRILFVCDGNTCRSPMAAALAMMQLTGVTADSAGIDAGEARARKPAIEVMKADYGIDLSAHHPRDVKDLNLEDFDLFVAMKRHIATDLESRMKVSPSRIVTWNVDDPAGGDAKLYRNCAAIIRANLEALSKQLEGQRRA